MATTSLSEINRAATDADLRARFIAAAAEAGIDVPAAWVDRHLQQLVATPLDSDGNTAASLYEYAVGQYKVPLPPGADPAYVQDAHIRAAVGKINTPPATTSAAATVG